MASQSTAASRERSRKSLHARGFAEKRTFAPRNATFAPRVCGYRGTWMPEITTTTAHGNDLPIHRIALPGTRALTVLVAFDARARHERPEENGMAHFLEHLVFKGGEKDTHY